MSVYNSPFNSASGLLAQSSLSSVLRVHSPAVALPPHNNYFLINVHRIRWLLRATFVPLAGPRRRGSGAEKGRERGWSSKVWTLELRSRTTPLYETSRVTAAWGLFGLIQQAQSGALGYGLQVCGENFITVNFHEASRGALRILGR